MLHIINKYNIGKVWAGHKVNFDFTFASSRLIAAYYDENRELVLASINLISNDITHYKLPVKTGWDSHNYIELAVDDEGILHLAADMHATPLIYFRSDKPYDISSMQRIDFMTGLDEDKCTYPVFMKGNDKDFIFHYRSGSSGNGSEIYNVYDYDAKTWKRLFNTPLTDGEGVRNAYFSGPVKGPDGYFHLVWMWRDKPDCETNHDISYMRSPDLIHWEKADGSPVSLPVHYDDKGLIFDHTPLCFSGLINMNNAIGFDEYGQVVISYHKYDESGFSQIYNARLKKGCWQIHKTSNWKSRWNFSQSGSIVCNVYASPMHVGKDGILTQKFYNFHEGSGKWFLDKDLNIIKTQECPFYELSPDILSVRGEYPGLRTRLLEKFGDYGMRYVMRWETLDAYQDRERPQPWPDASDLDIYEIKN